MITSRQVRAARAILGWTQLMLADRALVALTALKRLEKDLGVREDTRHQVQRALETAGVAFVVAERHEGMLIARSDDLPRT